MESREMLDVITKTFEEMDVFCVRADPEIVIFYQNVLGRVFKGQVFAKKNSLARVEFWLNLFGECINYDDIKERVDLVNTLLSPKDSAAEQSMGYIVNKEKHYLAVLADIYTNSEGNINVEQCKKRYQEIIVKISEHLTTVLP